MTKVSVIIPFVKDRGYLQEALDSVEAQTFKDYELILSQSENGVSYNINRGIERATGEFIKLLSDDDKLTPNSLQDLVAAMGDNDFIHAKAINFKGAIQNIVGPEVKIPTLQILLSKNHIHAATLMYRRDCAERFGKWDESLWTGEEVDYNMMILSKGAKVGYCDSAVCWYRVHGEQKSTGRKDTEHKNKRFEAIKQIKNRYR